MDKTAEIEKLKKRFNKSLQIIRTQLGVLRLIGGHDSLHIIANQFSVMTLIVEHLMNMLSANGAGKV